MTIDLWMYVAIFFGCLLGNTFGVIVLGVTCYVLGERKTRRERIAEEVKKRMLA